MALLINHLSILVVRPLLIVTIDNTAASVLREQIGLYSSINVRNPNITKLFSGLNSRMAKHQSVAIQNETDDRCSADLCMYFRALTQEVLGGSEKTSWSSCLDAIAVTAERIARHNLTVSATCDVDTASGLPAFPIHGRIMFTESVNNYSQGIK